MLGIGDFAQLTGLSAKALRLYDKQGLLKPAAVDPWSNYRRYSAGQLEMAIRLKALRAADIGLAEAERALLGRREAVEVLEEHRARLAEQRRRQDAALEAATALLDGDAPDWEIQERRAGAQHWVGVALPVSDGADEELTDEQANAAFGALWEALAAADNAPVGPFWSSIRAGSTEDDVELLCCWPVARPMPADWGGPGAGGRARRGPGGAGARGGLAARRRRGGHRLGGASRRRRAAGRGRAARRRPGPRGDAPGRAARRDRRRGRHGGRDPADLISAPAPPGTSRVDFARNQPSTCGEGGDFARNRHPPRHAKQVWKQQAQRDSSGLRRVGVQTRWRQAAIVLSSSDATR
ncbi:MerR family DNA-binding transcriptional regulator [Saccharopolyspora elongata]|uniref:MerR family DNA-binding transcriptional regulator n=1 Tax=Saccharopolyspora elongata TaxID=2530387 RepID=A0A4R4YUE0_9PSEU|nr:MerR family DNA-binding transcriptional regulator [Saccharopolyspora elongata]